MLKNLLKDSVVYGGADFVAKFLSFFAFPIIAAALSPAEFGLFELVITITALLGLVINCGLNNAVSRYYWDKDTKPEERPIIISSGFFAQIFFGLLVLLIGCSALPVLISILQPLDLPISWVGLLSAIGLMVASQWLRFLLDVTRLHFSPWYFFILSLISRVVGLALGVAAVVFMGWGIDGLLAVQALTSFATLPLAIWLVRKDITVYISRIWFVEVVRFGFPFIFAGMAHWLFASVDRWMLASMSSLDEVGIYSVAFRFASAVFFLSSAFGRAWSPNAIKIRTDSPGTYREFYSQVLIWLMFFMLVFGGGLALFSDELLYVIMPPEFQDSAVPLSILCFGIILQATLQVTAVGISIEKKTYLFVRMAWLTAIGNIGLNWFLIPLYGATGAAWATLASYFILTSGYVFYTQRLHPLPIPWATVILFLLLGGGVLSISIYTVSAVISWHVIVFKLLFAFLCICVVWQLLPRKDLLASSDNVKNSWL